MNKKKGEGGGNKKKKEKKRREGANLFLATRECLPLFAASRGELRDTVFGVLLLQDGSIGHAKEHVCTQGSVFIVCEHNLITLLLNENTVGKMETTNIKE